jgi:hypothetical protein
MTSDFNYSDDDMDNNSSECEFSTEDTLNAVTGWLSLLSPKELLKEAEKSRLMSYKVACKLSDFSTQNNLDIARYLGVISEVNRIEPEHDILKLVSLLTQYAQKFTELIETDTFVMQGLAADDPETYAKVLSYRRFILRKHFSLGQYSANYLTAYLKPDNYDIYGDHFKWHQAIESDELIKVLQVRGPRLSSYDL